MSEIKKILIANSTLTIEYKGGIKPPVQNACDVCTSAGMKCIDYGKYGAACDPTHSKSYNNLPNSNGLNASMYCSRNQGCGTAVAGGCIPGVSAPNWNCGNCALAGTQACGSLFCRKSKYSNQNDSTYQTYFPKSAITTSGETINIDGLAAVLSTGGYNDICSIEYPQPINGDSYGYLTPFGKDDVKVGKYGIAYRLTGHNPSNPSKKGTTVVVVTDACGACKWDPLVSNPRQIDISCDAAQKMGADELYPTPGGEPVITPNSCAMNVKPPLKSNAPVGYGFINLDYIEPICIKSYIFN